VLTSAKSSDSDGVGKLATSAFQKCQHQVLDRSERSARRPNVGAGPSGRGTGCGGQM